MRVSELMEKLETMPKDAIVVVWGTNGYDAERVSPDSVAVQSFVVHQNGITLPKYTSNMPTSECVVIE